MADKPGERYSSCLYPGTFTELNLCLRPRHIQFLGDHPGKGHLELSRAGPWQGEHGHVGQDSGEGAPIHERLVVDAKRGMSRCWVPVGHGSCNPREANQHGNGCGRLHMLVLDGEVHFCHQQYLVTVVIDPHARARQFRKVRYLNLLDRHMGSRESVARQHNASVLAPPVGLRTAESLYVGKRILSTLPPFHVRVPEFSHGVFAPNSH